VAPLADGVPVNPILPGERRGRQVGGLNLPAADL
jgi:hypothetical protein